MNVYPVVFRQFGAFSPTSPAAEKKTQSDEKLENLVTQIGQKTQLPDENRNYAILNQELVSKIVARKEEAVPFVTDFLKNTEDEKQVTEGLYVLDRMIDAGVKDIFKTYPVISKFNYTDSPNIQVMLAGIYRKTQVPDAFGPLMTMFLKNSEKPTKIPFDPNEEIGGAILEYLRNKTSIAQYGKAN